MSEFVPTEVTFLLGAFIGVMAGWLIRALMEGRH